MRGAADVGIKAAREEEIVVGLHMRARLLRMATTKSLRQVLICALIGLAIRLRSLSITLADIQPCFAIRTHSWAGGI